MWAYLLALKVNLANNRLSLCCKKCLVNFACSFKHDCAKAILHAHSSLVDYLARVIYGKNCPTTFYSIFQLVWVPMTTTQNISVCVSLAPENTFFIRVPSLEKENLNEFKGGTLMKKVFSRS
jgi:hypothetical protein